MEAIDWDNRCVDWRFKSRIYTAIENIIGEYYAEMAKLEWEGKKDISEYKKCMSECLTRHGGDKKQTERMSECAKQCQGASRQPGSVYERLNKYRQEFKEWKDIISALPECREK